MSEGQAAGWHLVFEITEDDERIFRSMSARDLRGYINNWIVRGIPLVTYLVMFGALSVAAQGYRLLPLSAVTTANAGYFVGCLAMMIAGLITASRVPKAVFRDTPGLNRRFDCSFDDDEIVIKIGLRETRMPWSAIGRVEDIRSTVIFWYQPILGFFIPVRAFSDANARAAFATWATARVQAAKANSMAAAPR